MNEYDNIINNPHYELKYYKRMSKESRSAQFAPFAALTGFSEDIIETGRLTKEKIDIFEDKKSLINLKLQRINKSIKETPTVTVLYFEKDKRKQGGAYLEYTGALKKIDVIEQKIKFTDGKTIDLNFVYDIKKK